MKVSGNNSDKISRINKLAYFWKKPKKHRVMKTSRIDLHVINLFSQFIDVDAYVRTAMVKVLSSTINISYLFVDNFTSFQGVKLNVWFCPRFVCKSESFSFWDWAERTTRTPAILFPLLCHVALNPSSMLQHFSAQSWYIWIGIFLSLSTHSKPLCVSLFFPSPFTYLSLIPSLFSPFIVNMSIYLTVN